MRRRLVGGKCTTGTTELTYLAGLTAVAVVAVTEEEDEDDDDEVVVVSLFEEEDWSVGFS